jgi:ribosome biogenesis GTPase
LNSFTGTVIRSTGSWYKVRQQDGTITDCRLKGRFKNQGIKTTNPIAVGDLVDFKMVEKEDNGVIHKIHPRQNFIVRKSTKLSKRAHILASNIDQLLLVVTITQPRTSTGFIDRFLMNAEAYDIPAILVFNKVDLYNDELVEFAAEWMAMYSDIGYTCIPVSAKSGFNLDELKKLMKGKTSLVAGHSGVGKSALINAMDDTKDIRIGEISEIHDKGKHTTTFSEMHHLNFDAYIIDSPGIKEFGVTDIEKEEVHHFFPEIFKYSEGCRFHNCTHDHEPDCAVVAAVEEGEIATSRYENYLRIMEGEEMQDPFYK